MTALAAGTMLDSPRNWVVSLLRGDAPLWRGGLEFLEQLLECARPERAHVLLIDALLSHREQSGLSPLVVSKLTSSLHQEFALEMLRQEALTRLVASLSEAGLSFLLFKGTPLAYTLYPQACLRDRCDTDILFESKTAAEEAWLIIRQLGYERINTVGGNLVSYQFPCIRRAGRLTEMVDVHWATSNAAQLRPLGFRELWARSVPVPQLGSAAQAPCHEHALILSCLHRLAHVKDGDGNKLIWLYDIHLLLTALGEEQWRNFLFCVQDKGIGSACLEGVEHAVQYFATPGCDARVEQLRSLAAAPGQALQVHASILGRDLSQFREMPGAHQRLRLLCEYLFPAPGYMTEKYQLPWGWLLPYYYVKRIVLGAWQRVRAHFGRLS